MSSSEEIDDPLYDAVFNSDGGKAVIGGVVVTLVAMLPSYGALSIFNPNGEASKQQAKIQEIRAQSITLNDAASVLIQNNDTDLANQLHQEAVTLSLQADTLEANIPAHMNQEVTADLLLAAPLIVGTLSAIGLYRFLRKH